MFILWAAENVKLPEIQMTDSTGFTYLEPITSRTMSQTSSDFRLDLLSPKSVTQKEKRSVSISSNVSTIFMPRSPDSQARRKSNARSPLKRDSISFINREVQRKLWTEDRLYRFEVQRCGEQFREIKSLKKDVQSLSSENLEYRAEIRRQNAELREKEKAIKSLQNQLKKESGNFRAQYLGLREIYNKHKETSRLYTPRPPKDSGQSLSSRVRRVEQENKILRANIRKRQYIDQCRQEVREKFGS